MTVTKEALQEILDYNPERKAGGKVDNWFHPSHNKNTGGTAQVRIRVLPRFPPRDGELYLGKPFFDLKLHYFRGEKYLSGVCPSARKENPVSCPACDWFFSLVSNPAVQENKTLKETIRKVAPEQRTFANVYDYGNEGVKIYSIARGAFKKLDAQFKAMASFGVLLHHPVEGRDLVLTMGPVGDGKNSMVTEVTVAPAATSMESVDWAGGLFDLEGAARQREFSVEDVEAQIPAMLGDHYEVLGKLSGKIPS